MTLLAIDTATTCASVALWEDGAPLASARVVGGRLHAEVLMPMVDDLHRRAGRSVADLEAVAVDVGPGLFTGLRVGLAAASSISLALGVPAQGVTSLEVLAHPHRRCPGLVASVVDARRGEVYWALYATGGSGLEPVVAPEVVAPGAVVEALSARQDKALAVGDGAWRYRELLGTVAEVAGPADLWPSADVVAELGARALALTGAPSAPPHPLYLRQADVRVGWEQVGGRVGEPRPGP